MHAASTESSPRLKRVLELLQRGGEHSTRDIMAGAHVCAVSACISELRAGGHAVECKRRDGLFFYSLPAPVEVAA